MPIIYNKMISLMNERGITSYVCKRDNIIGQATYKKIMQGGDIDTRTIATMCEVLGCQPGDLLEYVKEDNPLGITKREKTELRKLIQLIPDCQVDEMKASLLDLIRTDDWYDLSEDEHRERISDLLSKHNPRDKQLY